MRGRRRRRLQGEVLDKIDVLVLDVFTFFISLLSVELFYCIIIIIASYTNNNRITIPSLILR